VVVCFVQSMLNKIEETRERIRSEYDPECSGRYQPVDVQRLWEDDGFVASYLEAKRHVVADTVKMIDESLQWRNEFSVNEDNLQKSFLEAGMHYFRGYDKDGNKLFWFRLKLQAKDSRTLQEKKRYLAFWLERFVRHEPGALLTTVFDMSESGLGNVDMEFLRFLITCFQVYYPRLLAKILIFELPWIMNAAWKIVKSWLGPDAIDKLKFVTRHDVQTYIELEQLPLHMGGMDVFEYSYPPLPDDDFQPPLSESGQGEAGDAGVKETADPEPRLRKVCGNRMAPQRTVRTTAPDNYRVKPSSGVLDPGSSVEIMVSLHGGSQASPQDRFLVMAAEMEKAVAGENQDLAQFWKDIPKTKVMEHRLQCKVLQGVKPAYIQTTNPHADLTNGTGGQQDTHTMVTGPPDWFKRHCMVKNHVVYYNTKTFYLLPLNTIL
uniref:Motile sperm domain-containing protein 2-like n=1 Tax=Gadus morhua TaxID=8049 RepID=A0A8C5F904_GADMO